VSRPDLVLHAPRAVLGAGAAERPCSVSVRDGVVVAVGDLDPSLTGRETVRLPDDVVLVPGLVDTHVHVNEPGRTEWEGFASATRAAAAGGVTTLVDMPLNSLPPTLDPGALALKRAAAQGRCAVDVGFWGGAVPANLGGLGALLDAGAFGVKCFLSDSGVPEFPPLDPAGLLAACAELAAADGLLLVHAEDPGVLAQAPAPSGTSYPRFLGSRPASAEEAAVATVLDAARRTGARVHIVHLSAAGALPGLAAARAEGVRVTVETCPHYLTLAAERVPAGGTQFKCCPPIRDEANRDALWAGLADGTIDAVVSDHSPCPAAMKELESGDFGAAWGGISSLQLGLALVWTEARRRGHPLGDVVGWMAGGPARVAGLTGKGRLAVGAAADLVALAPDEEAVVEPERLHHRHPVTPYAGARLTGVVRATWLAGQPVTDGDRRGRLLARGEKPWAATA
jgi:allantoinase